MEQKPPTTERPSASARVKEALRPVMTEVKEHLGRKPSQEAIKVGHERVTPLREAIGKIKETLKEVASQLENKEERLADLHQEAQEARGANPIEGTLTEEVEKVSDAHRIDESAELAEDVQQSLLDRLMGRRPEVTPKALSEQALLAKFLISGKVSLEQAREYVSQVVRETANEIAARTTSVAGENVQRFMIGFSESIRKRSRAVKRIEDEATRAETARMGFTKEIEGCKTKQEKVGGKLRSWRVQRVLGAEVGSLSLAKEYAESFVDRVNKKMEGLLEKFHEVNSDVRTAVSELLASRGIKLEETADGAEVDQLVKEYAQVDGETTAKLSLEREIAQQCSLDPEASLDNKGRIVVAKETEGRVKDALEGRLKEAEKTIAQRRIETAVAVVNFQAGYDGKTGDVGEVNEGMVTNLKLLADRLGLEIKDSTFQDAAERRAVSQTIHDLIRHNDRGQGAIFDTFKTEGRVSELVQDGFTLQLKDEKLVAIKGKEEVTIEEKAEDWLSEKKSLQAISETRNAKFDALWQMWEAGMDKDSVGARETWRRLMIEAELGKETIKKSSEALKKLVGAIYPIYETYERDLTRILGGVGALGLGVVPEVGVARLKEEAVGIEKKVVDISDSVRRRLAETGNIFERHLGTWVGEPKRVAQEITQKLRGVKLVYERAGEPPEEFEARKKAHEDEVRGVVTGYIMEVVRGRLERKVKGVNF